MDISNIPKSFWHSLSVSVLIFTFGFTWISYKSGNLTLRYKDFEISTASALKEMGEAEAILKKNLKESAYEMQRLGEAREHAENALALAKMKLDETQASLAAGGATESADRITTLQKELKEAFRAVNSKPENLLKESESTPRLEDFRQVRQKIDNLEAIQKQIKEQAGRKS